ncbi:hypothetical protein ACJX0J_021109, partial [Zea mays]
ANKKSSKFLDNELLFNKLTVLKWHNENYKNTFGTQRQKVKSLFFFNQHNSGISFHHLENNSGTNMLPEDTTNAYRQKVMINYTSVCIVNHNLEENNYTSVILFSIPKNGYHHIHLENNYTNFHHLENNSATNMLPQDTTNAYRQKVMNNYTSVCIVNHNLEENNYTSISAQNILQSHKTSSFGKQLSVSIWRTIIPMFEVIIWSEVITKVVSAFQGAHMIMGINRKGLYLNKKDIDQIGINLVLPSLV